jgi:hypothetical protein
MAILILAVRFAGNWISLEPQMIVVTAQNLCETVNDDRDCERIQKKAPIGTGIEIRHWSL